MPQNRSLPSDSDRSSMKKDASFITSHQKLGVRCDTQSVSTSFIAGLKKVKRKAWNRKRKIKKVKLAVWKKTEKQQITATIHQHQHHHHNKKHLQPNLYFLQRGK